MPLVSSRFYLETKASRAGHWIDFEGKEHLDEQSDAVRVEGMPVAASAAEEEGS